MLQPGRGNLKMKDRYRPTDHKQKCVTRSAAVPLTQLLRRSSGTDRRLHCELCRATVPPQRLMTCHWFDYRFECQTAATT